MTTITTLFSGGEGVGIGAEAAGLSHLYGIESNDAIAQVARDNGFDVITADILEVDPSSFERPDVLHASPPCPNFSQAKTGAVETEHDIDLARATARFIETLLPKIFTLENVYLYRKSKSWAIIADALHRCGYWFDLALVNSADYGIMRLCPLHALECTLENVPNAARRSNRDFKTIAPDIVASLAMMKPNDQARFLAWDVVARLGRIMQQDIAVDATWQRSAKKLGESEGKTVQVGRVADILTSVDTSESRSTQSISESIGWLLKKCLGDHSLKKRWYTTSTEIQQITVQKILGCLLATKIIQQSTTRKERSHQDGKSGTSGNDCPLCKYESVPQTRKRMWVRAIRGQMVPHLPPAEPWIGWYEAIEDLIPTLPESEFAPWQLARLKLNETTLVDSAGYSDESGRVPVTRCSNEPANTILANHAGRGIRAFLVGGQFAQPSNSTGEPRPAQVRGRDESAFTVTAVNKGDWRVWLSQGRVVQMTPRALARLQTFPDDYRLPARRTLACRVIGMAVPPLLYQKLVGPLVRCIEA